MPSIDPGQLLKALSPLLLPNGGLRDPEAATRVVSLMKDATKLVGKCVYINIMRATQRTDVLQKFISGGGWDVMNKWLNQAKDDENMPILIELLQVYQHLPVTVDDLKKDNTARIIKTLNKSENEAVRSLSTTVVDNWMRKIKDKKTNESENDKSKKKKKKDKDREKEVEEKDKSKDKKDKDKNRHRRDERRSRSTEKKDGDKKDGDDISRNSDDENSIDNSDSVEDSLSGSQDISINMEEVKKEEEDEEKAIRKPKTVRVFTKKFRSVFEEDDSPLPPIKKKTPDELKMTLPLPKRSSDSAREEPSEKIPRLTLKMPPLVPDGTLQSSSVTSPTNTSPPEVTHGRIKIIPPKRPPAHEIHDSNVFMNELTKSTYQHGAIKRKKKNSGTPGTPKPVGGKVTSPTTPTTPTLLPASPTPPPPISPMTATAQKLPSVPSFYRDTLETQDEIPSLQEKNERSPSPIERVEQTDNMEIPTLEKMDDIVVNQTESFDVDMKEEVPILEYQTDVVENGRETNQTLARDESPEMLKDTSQALGDGEPKSLLATSGGGQPKKARKRVSWADESSLREVFYFELDETERENVNRPKTFSELKKQEILSEGRAMECAKRLINDNMTEVLPWRRPPPIDNLVVSVVQGCNSAEKDVQQLREQGVLQALFFTKAMLPDSPSEPEMESVEPSETKLIPLEDETSSAEEYEHTYNIDPGNMPYDPGYDIASQNVGNSAGGINTVSGLQLPTDLSNMLASIQQQSIATGGQSLQANGAVMANVQNILAMIMNSGQGSNSEDLINKLRIALEPMKNQISGGPMQMMNPQDPNAHFRPQGPPRHSLLGTAPPGFGPGPMMVGPRPHFQQGPVMGGMEGGDGWNPMGMPRPGPVGPGFHPMQPGPMQGVPNMGGGGPVMPGPRGMMRNSRRGQRPVCRHFAAHNVCRFGNSCAFLHPGLNGPPLAQ